MSATGTALTPIVGHPGDVDDPMKPKGPVNKVYGFLRSIPTWVLWIIVIVWSVPTLGLFVNS